MTLWAQTNSVGAGFNMFIYYTTDGSFPEGAGGVGVGHDAGGGNALRQ